MDECSYEIEDDSLYVGEVSTLLYCAILILRVNVDSLIIRFRHGTIAKSREIVPLGFRTF